MLGATRGDVVQSTLAPTCLISAPQCLESCSTSLANSAGESVTRSKLFLSKNSFDCGRAGSLLAAAGIFVPRAAGMLAGPNSANHTVVQNPGTPASAMVGSSGRTCARLL